MNQNIKGIFIALAAFGTYATHDAVIKQLGGAYNPIQILFFSVLLGFPLIMLSLTSSREPQSLRPSNVKQVALRSALMVSGGVCGFTTFTLLPMAQAYVMLFGAPLIVTLLAQPVLGERLGWHRGLAVALGMIGVAVALNPEGTPLGLGHLAGAGAALSIAGVSIMTRTLRDTERPIVLMLYPMLINLVVTGLALPWIYVAMPLLDLGLMALVALLAFSAARLTISAFSIGEASVVAPMQYSQILWAGFFGAVFFHESITQNVIIGSVLVIGCGVYILFRESKTSGNGKPLMRGRSRSFLNPVSPIQQDETIEK